MDLGTTGPGALWVLWLAGVAAGCGSNRGRDIWVLWLAGVAADFGANRVAAGFGATRVAAPFGSTRAGDLWASLLPEPSWVPDGSLLPGGGFKETSGLDFKTGCACHG